MILEAEWLLLSTFISLAWCVGLEADDGVVSAGSPELEGTLNQRSGFYRELGGTLTDPI